MLTDVLAGGEGGGGSTVQFLTSATAVKGDGKRPFTLDDLTQRFRGFAWREKRRCDYLIGSMGAEGYLIGSLKAGASPPQGCRKEKVVQEAGSDQRLPILK